MKVYSVMYTDTLDSDSVSYERYSHISSICVTKKAAWKRVEEIFDSWMELLCFGPRRGDYKIISITVNPCQRDRVKIIFTKGLDMRVIIIDIEQFELEK